MDSTAFIQRTLALLAFERDTDLAQTSLLASKCSPRLLQSRGLAILSLSPANVSIGLGGKTLVELQKSIRGMQLPAHTFRQGDTAEIIDEAALKVKESGKKQPNSNSAISSLQGVVYKVHEDRIVIALNPRSGSSEDKDPDIPQKCTLRKLANTVTYDRMEKTLLRLSKLLSTPSPPELIEILFSLRQPTFSPLPSSLLSPSGLKYYNENLNDSQKDAVKFAVYQADQIALIHGPPGTGKTSTLIEIILHIIKSPDKPQQRVLVCSASNLAVDNILERLLPYSSAKEAGGGFGITRLGHPARIMPQLSRNTLDYQINHSNQGMVHKELKEEIEGLTKKLGSGKMRGKERKEGWGEVRELRKEYRKREGTVVAGVVKQASVVPATCHGAGSRQLDNQVFDVLIIDEAAQALEAVCWIPLLRTAKKVILAGDHLQLPPTLKSKNERLPKELRVETERRKNGKTDGKKGTKEDEASSSDSEEEGKEAGADKAGKADGQTNVNKIQPRSLQVTLFDRLLSMYGGKVKRLLNVQYRMNEKIMSFPSKTLYNSELVAHPSVQARLLSDLPNLSFTALENDDGLLTESVIFYDTAGASMYERAEEDASDGESKKTIDGESKSNENEADIVMKFIDELITAGVPQDSISVITPYVAQLNLLKSLLHEKYPPSILSSDSDTTSANTRGIEAASVDGFQGREKDVIVLSLVRSNDKKEVGFLADKRRLNVAMTRAKRCLCVVGDSDTVRNGGKFLKDWMDWLEENADVRVVQ